MNPKAFFVSANGGTVAFLSEEGEVYAEAPIPPGRVAVRDYLGMAPPGAIVELSDGVAVQNPAPGFHRQKYGEGSHHSGANPDFRPTSADRIQRELRLTLNRMQAATARVEARERALAKVQRVPDRPKAGEAEVIEREAPAVVQAADDKPAVE